MIVVCTGAGQLRRVLGDGDDALVVWSGRGYSPSIVLHRGTPRARAGASGRYVAIAGGRRTYLVYGAPASDVGELKRRIS